MKGKVSRKILGCYDLLLAAGAIYNGLIMVSGKWWDGEWPDVWIGKVPFTSWFWPGVIAIILYGIGNLIAGYYSFSKKKKGYIASGVMGIFFLLSLLASFVVLGESYLATFMFIILSVIQMILTICAYKKYAVVSVVMIIGLTCFIGYKEYSTRAHNALNNYSIIVNNE